MSQNQINPPASGAPVRLEVEGDVGIVVVDNPPANAASRGVREGLLAALAALAANPALRAGVITGAGGTFIAGADIRELAGPMAPPDLPTVIAAIEACPKPVVAAISGAALGGGLEIALGCDARVAAADALIGLPEVTLGTIPGAGGTQRLPRLVGLRNAVEMIATGRRIDGQAAAVLGIVDRVVAGPLLAAAIGHARELTGKRLVRELPAPRAAPQEIAALSAEILRRAGGAAVSAAIATVQLAATVPIGEALRRERETFTALRAGEEAAALRHLFFAERAARKVKRPADVASPLINSVAVVGAGTMGAGIAAAFAASGLPVVVCDTSAEARACAPAVVTSAIDALFRADAAAAAAAGARLTIADAVAGAARADLIIEAVFEDVAVKTAVMREIAASARPEAIIATNTSYLDLDALAAATGTPARVLGLHFFAPAHRMKLLEVVRGRLTSPAALLAGIEVARRLGKVAVVANAGEGFIGNRVFARYRAEAEFMLEEGALPEEVDAAAEVIGFAMGPFAVADLSGLDIAWRMRRSKAATRDPRVRYVPIADVLCEMGRLGRKTGIGWYDYPVGGKGRGQPSPVVAEIVARQRRAGAAAAAPDAPTIGRRLLGAIVNEAANVVADGIARAPGDIDVVFVNGYGFSRLKGGPVFQAMRLPPDDLRRMLDEVEASAGFGFRRGDVGLLAGAGKPV